MPHDAPRRWLSLVLLPLGGCLGSTASQSAADIDPGMLMAVLDAQGDGQALQPTDVTVQRSELGARSVSFGCGGLKCAIHHLERQGLYLGVARGHIPPAVQTHYLFDASGSLLSTDQVGWHDDAPELTLSALRLGADEDLVIRWGDAALCRSTDHVRILAVQPDGFHRIADVDERVSTCSDYDGADAVYGRFDTTTWSFTDVDSDGTSELTLDRVEREGPDPGDWGSPTGRVVREARTVLQPDADGRYSTEL